VTSSQRGNAFFHPFPQPSFFHFMNKQLLSKALGGALLCVLGTLSAQEAHAQATLSGNVLYGNANGPGGNFQITTAPAGVDGPYFHFYTNNNGDTNSGTTGFISGYNSNPNAIAHGFLNRRADGGFVRTMSIYQSGQVRIGDRWPTSQPTYKLAVDGLLVSTSMYVTNPTTWADFVFEPSYKLMALPTLEKYLLTNKHLPYIPSAKEVETNGYNVAEMDAKLLRTVEELTLQVIALSKQVEEMKAGKGITQDTK
jgi:hypothetical protein